MLLDLIESIQVFLKELSPWFYALLIGFIASFWSKIKSWFKYLLSYGIVTHYLLSSEFSGFVLIELCKKLKGSRYGDRSWSSRSFFVRPLKSTKEIIYEKLGYNNKVFWRWIFPVWISANNSNNEKPTETATVTFIRGTFNMEEFLLYLSDLYEKEESNSERRFRIQHMYGNRGIASTNGRNDEDSPKSDTPYEEISLNRQNIIPLKWKIEELGALQSKKSIEILSIDKNVGKMIADIKRWHTSKNWFLERSLPWKRGYLLYGKPGTGKTSIVRAIGEVLDMPIYTYDLASMTNKNFSGDWRRMLSNTPAIGLIEDIDTIFEGKKNITKGFNGEGLTFDGMLNTIDGVERVNGLILFITTNCPDKLDPALGSVNGGISSRPGRIDNSVEFRLLDKEGRIKMANRILSDIPKEIENLVNDKKEYTPAQFQELCVLKALELWENENKVAE